MSAVQSVKCLAHRNGVLNTENFDIVDVVIDGKIDANGNKLCSTSSSDEETISSTSSDSLKEDELGLTTRYKNDRSVIIRSCNRIKSHFMPLH